MPQPEWTKGQVRALAQRRGLHGTVTADQHDLYVNRGGGAAKSVSSLQHATPHGTTGKDTPHDKAMMAAHAGKQHGSPVMTDSKGGEYKISPSGKKEYLGK